MYLPPHFKHFRSRELPVLKCISNVLCTVLALTCKYFFLYVLGSEFAAVSLRLLCAAELFKSAQAYATHEALKTDDDFGMSLSYEAEQNINKTQVNMI
jgi:hypothetical protein